MPPPPDPWFPGCGRDITLDDLPPGWMPGWSPSCIDYIHETGPSIQSEWHCGDWVWNVYDGRHHYDRFPSLLDAFASCDTSGPVIPNRWSCPWPDAAPVHSGPALAHPAPITPADAGASDAGRGGVEPIGDPSPSAFVRHHYRPPFRACPAGAFVYSADGMAASREGFAGPPDAYTPERPFIPRGWGRVGKLRNADAVMDAWEQWAGPILASDTDAAALAARLNAAYALPIPAGASVAGRGDVDDNWRS